MRSALPPLAMVCLPVSDARIGDGFRTGFVLAQRRESVVLYVPSLLTSVTVPSRSLEQAQAIVYRPKVVRGHMLARARLYRKHGHRFSQGTTIEVLHRLGAGRTMIEETVSTAPLPEVVAARERKAAQAERAAETAAVVAAIGARIDLRLEEERLRPAAARRSRRPTVHPDQLALAL